MLLQHAMHPRLPNHGNQVSNLQHPDKDPLIDRVEAFSDGVFAIAITLLALGLTVPHVQLTASPSLLLHALLATPFDQSDIAHPIRKGLLEFSRQPSSSFLITLGGTVLDAEIQWLNHAALLQS